MKTSFIIIFDNITDIDHRNEFIEAIRSNFVSKQGRENMFIIIQDKRIEPKDIYELIESKTSFELDILICEFENFYGNFMSREVTEWIVSQYPNKEWIKDYDE